MTRLRMFIDGNWCESEDGRFFDAFDPSSMRVIAQVPAGTRADADRAVRAAHEAQARVGRMTVWDRARMLHRVADEMEKSRTELARALSEDQGKPYFTEALPEVDLAIAGFREASEHAKFLETPAISVRDGNKRVWSVRQPRGVYAIVTPWNFPINIPVEYLAPGLAMGNTLVWAPAPTTSVCAIRLLECLERADLPAGAVNLVTGPGPIVGNAIVAHPLTSAVGFTGSPATGRKVAEAAAGKPMLLELGGNGPTVVLEDADVTRAATAIALGCFFNAGQVCSATERIIVARRSHESLLTGLISAAKKYRLGSPLSADTTLGPLNNEAVADKTSRHLHDCQVKGAVILTGGRRAAEFGSELFFEPTVIDRVSSDMQIAQEETFGPVAPVMVAGSDDEALALANSGPYGLVGSVWTTDMKRAFRFAEAIRTGIVNINETSAYWEPHIPFGGMSGKNSGIGRIGGRHSLEAMSDLKTIVLDLS